MTTSTLEVAMQTMGSVVSEYLPRENGVLKGSKEGLKKLVNEQFPHFEKKELSSGGYRIRIPLNKTSPGHSPLNFQEAPRGPAEDNENLLDQFFDYIDDIVTMVFEERRRR